MPGLIGIASAQAPADVQQRHARARGRLLHAGRSAVDEWSTGNGGAIAGRVRLAQSNRGAASTTPAVADSPRVIFQGALYNYAELKAHAEEQRILEFRSQSATSIEQIEALLPALYSRYGDAFVSRLEGEFALLVLDPQRHRLVAATDVAGNYPLFWHSSSDGVIVATSLSSVVAALPDTRLDLRAVADYLTCGMVLGVKTLAKDVRALDAGTILVHDIATSRTTITSYCDPVSLFAPKASRKDDYLESVIAAFMRAVNRALDHNGKAGLSLSGGLDSRAILSAANGRASKLLTYTLGVPGCADEVIADQLARIAGTQHTFFALDASYLRDFLPNMAEMVSLTGGMYLSHGLTEMLALRFLDDTGVSVLLRGHGGELAKAHLAWPLHTDRQVYALRSAEELISYLAQRANYITPTVPLDRILSPDARAAAGEGARESFRDVLHGTTLCPADCCSYLYLREQHRRFTVPSLELFRSRVEVRLPFVDSAFLKVLLAAPPEWRDSTEIHRRITAAGLPALGRVRDSNTGAPANAGPAATFVFDKVNSVLKRLNVAGYRHYHNFDGWMRRTLLDSVEAELLGRDARVLAYVSKPALAAFIGETRTGAADHSYLLQVLLILELWQRENRVEAAA